MSKYFCYRKHPDIFIGRTPESIIAILPAHREYMSYEQWLAWGCPKDDSITFRGIGKGNWKRNLKWKFGVDK